MTKAQKDLERFYTELGEIEALKSQNFFDNLTALGGLVKNVAQYAEARERNREARESLKFAKNLYEEKQDQFLEFQEKRLDMNEAEQEAALREIAGDNEEVYDFLKLQFAPTLEGLETDEFIQRYDDFATSGLKSRIQAKNVLNLPTRLDASDAIDDTIENIVTKYLIDADAKGLNVQSRDLRRHFLKELYPALVKAKEETLRTYDRVSTNNYLKNVDRWTNWYGKGRCPCHHGAPDLCHPDTEVSGFVQADRIVNGKIMFRFTWQIKLEKIGFTISQPLVEKLDPVAIPTHDRCKFYTRPTVPKED